MVTVQVLRRSETFWTLERAKASRVEPTDIRTRLRDPAEDAAAAPVPAGRAPLAPAATTQVLPPSAFRTGRAEDALRDALGYGLYARAAEDGREPARAAGDPATADMVERYRSQANADMHAFAFRYMHNQAEQIRTDAVREHLAALRRPPGFGTLVLANLAAIALAWLAWGLIAPAADAAGGAAGLAGQLLGWLRGLLG